MCVSGVLDRITHLSDMKGIDSQKKVYALLRILFIQMFVLRKVPIQFYYSLFRHTPETKPFQNTKHNTKHYVQLYHIRSV